MAAAEAVRWSSVVGEYGVLLTEMGSMEELLSPIKPYPRIKYTCMTASKKYIALGSSTGGLYIFDRKTRKHLRFISNKDGPILAACFTQWRSLLGVVTSPGIVLVWEVSSRHRERPKLIRRSEEHKNTTITALCWDEEESRLFIGDVKGVVSVVHVPTKGKMPHSVKPLLHTTGIVAKAHTGIVQLDCVGDKLLVSTITKCAIVDLKSMDCVPVGVKLRDGLYGGCFFKEGVSGSPAIYAARPGSRLWEASIDGQVMSTQQYKKLLGTPPVPILGCGRSAIESITEEDFPPQSVNFAKLLLVRDRFLVTWHGTSLYIMDPILGQLVAWYAMDTVVEDIVCVGEEFYVYDAEDSVKWFALLSVKECVSRLYTMGEIEQCLNVLLSCKHYIIPGSARDFVPVSLVAKLRESLHEESKEDKEDLIGELEELEHDMEPATEVSDYPPSYLSNTSLTDSPDTLSVCSDAFTDDLELNVPSPGGRTLETEEDNDNLSTTQSDNGGKGGLHRTLKKQWSADISFEGMLMSAAAAAKKFKAERQKGINKLKKSQSADSPGRQLSSPGADNAADPHHKVGDSQNKFADTDTGQQTERLDIQETIQEEESPLLQKKILEQSPCHSDDSESRQSGNEGGAAEEETLDKKEKISLREKKKRKKRVVTVDIDSPQLKPESTPAPYGRSSSFRGSSSTEDTEVRSRRLSEPVSPIQTELPPAIPAMLSKAKGLLKKKLKPSSEGPSSLSSPTPPAEEETMDNVEEESQKIKCPPEVEELIECSAKTRNEVKNPLVLFSISSLRQAFEEWIPKLHGAMKSCLELNKSNEGNNATIDLKYFLDGLAFADVSYLARMCFDCGVYGLEGMESLQDVSSDAISNTKTSSSSSLMVHDNAEMTDLKNLKDGESNVLLSNSSETVMEHELEKCDSSSSHEGIETMTDELTEAGSSDGSTSHSDAPTSSSISTNVEEESCKGDTLDSDSKEELGVVVVEVNGDIVKPQKVSPRGVNGSLDKSTNITFSLHDVISKNALSTPNCEPICGLCQNGSAFCRRDNGEVNTQISTQEEDDSIRSKFLAYYFFVLDVKQLRRTLFMSRGDRRRTWKTFVDCLSSLVTTDDVIAKYIKEGDARRALHELHDGMDAYSNILLYHLTRLYEHDSRETMITCARMFPDVQPWEVMEMCRQSSALSLESGSADFVFYVEQLMRWRAEVGNTKEQTIVKICEDITIAKWWFHCSLIVDSSREALHCQHCGKPRPGSHTLQWQKIDHLQQLIDFLCQRDPKDYKDFMDLCWKHGYWSGLIRLCVQANRRQEALQLVVSLSDLKLIRDTQPWGLLPKTLDEWRYLLDLLLSRDHCANDSRDTPHSCTPLSTPDWLPDLTWSNVINLMLERLGTGHTVNLLQALPRDTPLLSTEFYYSCLLGAVIERRQRTLIHELLKKLDSYLWSQRSGSLAPKLNNFRKEEETCSPTSKEDVKPQLESMSQFRTLEDGASNWGQNIRLSDGECLVCSLKLCEQISTSNQGLLLFECGHVFHKHCVPEAACVLCFHQNLTTLGTKVL